MKSYYLDSKPEKKGVHIVHKEDCHRLPFVAEKLFLGDFLNCYEAVKEAGNNFKGVNGCIYCSASCHDHK